ncbi:MAG: hypothetical protein IKF14_17490 [Atopobiaceae bacterium]|nr:hypothetical protein [Atopobiaceae bacterium]
MGYGQLKLEGYLPRIADGQLERMLATFGAVEVAGTMWCGKTWTSLAFGKSVTRIGLAGPRAAAEVDPGIALLGDQPHVVDEWQDVPAIWDEVRAAVDASGTSQAPSSSRAPRSRGRAWFITAVPGGLASSA